MEPQPVNSLTRLKEYLDYKAITIAEFERMALWSNGSLGAQLKKNGTVGLNKIENILSVFPNLNLEWLITGNGVREKSDQVTTINEPQEIYSLSTERRHVSQLIPLFDVAATAGKVELYDSNSNNIIDYLSIPNMPKCDGAMAVVGDSMYPLVKSGDLVLYKVVTDDLPYSLLWGQMYLISVKNDGEYLKMVKFVHKSDNGDQWIKLVSQNAHHAPLDVKLKNIGAMGLIKGLFRYTLT